METTTPSTENLLQRMATADDRQAFGLFFTRYHAPLVTFALQYVKARELAEEVVSDVFLKLWNKRETLPAIQSITSYLYVAVKNQALNYRLRVENQPTLALDDVITEHPVDIMTPERTLLTQELQADITRAVNSLPPQCQAIFRLVREDGLKYKEVADIMGLAPKTVDVQMGIAIKKISVALRQHLADQSRPGRTLRIAGLWLPLLLSVASG
ncbi:RNA polymerase sigma-70 factor [Hymenobacter swuensis]|nr:RNA polymerase sigma-70 factor [Hymenobacter swuensis]